MRRRVIVTGCIALAMLSVPPVTHAEDTDCGEATVPVPHLIAQLEAFVRKYPEWIDPRIALARAHLAAFATKKQALDICKYGSPVGDDPIEMVPMVMEALDPVVRETAPPSSPLGRERERDTRAHLREGTRGYRRVLDMYTKAPDRERAGLLFVYTWARQQSGVSKKDVIAGYRTVISLARPSDEAKYPPPSGIQPLMIDGKQVLIFLTSGEPDPPSMTERAAERLLPLLDVRRDAAEIAALRERAAFMAERRVAHCGCRMPGR